MRPSGSTRREACGRALTEVARDFTAAHGMPVVLVFGASGLLRERLEGGEPGDVFAPANMEHPRRSPGAGRPGRWSCSRETVLRPGAPGGRGPVDTLLDRILDPA